MDSYRIQKTHDGKIPLPGGASVIDPILSGGGKKAAEDETEPLPRSSESFAGSKRIE